MEENEVRTSYSEALEKLTTLKRAAITPLAEMAKARRSYAHVVAQLVEDRLNEVR
jgi:hypothetical protein